MENTFYEKAAELRERLCEVLYAGVYDYDKLEAAWRAYFTLFLEDKCWNEAAITDLFNWGKHGHNWRLLHWNLPDTADEYERRMNEMRVDVVYASDRMTFDHLVRQHHMYNAIQSREAILRYINS